MSKQGSQPAIFLDRDGVVNRNRADYVLSWSQIELLPQVLPALQRIALSPFQVVIVTNQSAVGRGLLTLSDLQAIHESLLARVRAGGGYIDAIYACPHHPDAGCPCRKPRPGLLTQAAADLSIDLSHSYLVGDAVTDVQAALAVGCQPLMVRTGRGESQLDRLRSDGYEHVPVVADLAAAVDWIQAQVPW